MIPYKVFTHYSILRSFNHIDKLTTKAQTLGFNFLPITDYHSIAGCVEFIESCQVKDIIPILGCTFNVKYKEVFGTVTVWCKNKDGWFDICRALNKTKYVKEEPYVDLTDLNSSNWIVFVGGLGSLDVADKDSSTYFKGDDVYNVGSETDWVPVYYPNDTDLIYQRILVCSRNKCHFHNYKENITGEWDLSFFGNDPKNFLRDPKEYKNLPLITTKISKFSITSKPNIPIYDPSINPDDKLTEICRNGWDSRKMNEKTKNDPELKKIYVDRIKAELKTFKEANLSNYMLVVWDIVRFARENGVNIGLRGSSVGCMIVYLIGLTDVDPLRPDPTLPYKKERALIFERFYSKYRNTKDHISLPDIDIDVSIGFRKNLIDYIIGKYGKDKVSYISTFSRLDGKGAIKEVFRILDSVPNPFYVSDQISKMIVDKAKVQDIIEDIRQKKPDYTTIDYSIETVKEVKEAYQEYKTEFDIAIKISDTIKSQGQHAAGVIIANESMANILPVRYDTETGDAILMFEMEDAEKVGAVKFDILGVAALEKMSCIVEMINKSLKEPNIIKEMANDI